MTPTERLARAMGYETRTESPGYGVTRVLIKVGELGNWQVFDPRKDGAQGLEVLAWLASQTCIDWHKPDCRAIGGENQIVLCDFDGLEFSHNGTGPDLMRAVCDAAERVAEGVANGN